MKKIGLFVVTLFFAFQANAQSIGGYEVFDFLVTAIHPNGCDPDFVTGPPNDSTWVNLNNWDVMTGTFGSQWSDGPGDDLLLETSYHPDNYDVRLLLSTGLYSGICNVTDHDWVQIADTPWIHLFRNCSVDMQSVERYIYPLDFGQDFGLSSSDIVTGIEIVFLVTTGAPDLAGVYIISESPPCDTINLGPDTTLCQGETYLLDATTPDATYLWQDNSTDPTFLVYQPGIYWVEVSTGSCITIDSIEILYDSIPVVTNDPLFKVICSGESTNILLTSSVLNTTFSWNATGSSPIVTGFFSGTGNTINQILTNSGSVLETVFYWITPVIANCIGDSVQFSVDVTPEDSVLISIVSSTDSVCEGIPVAFTGTTINGGSTPSFHWQVNGINQGINNAVFIYSPSVNDTISCILSSSDTVCITNNPATSNEIIMTVIPLLPISISISPSANPVCGGIPVTFTATSVNGGTNPNYQWKVNGTNAGTNSPIFTYVPMTNNQITCILTSSESCTSGNPASGNPIIMTVVEAPEVTFTPCFDTITTTNAKPIKLKGGIPLGGTYSGSGTGWTSETGWTFYPATAGPGIHQITYSYTNSALCSDAGSLMLDTRSASPFSCGNLLLDIRDNQSYLTVLIDSQCWFASTLNYGTEIPYTTPQRDNCIPEKYKSAVGSLQFAVYQWDEMMCYQNSEEIQGLC
ncbi:MAG: hypothetical protein IH596_11565, partial [Bacteroidales bacterium]|nr:hypothetical protein [Bacteroidales bacterium]